MTVVLIDMLYLIVFIIVIFTNTIGILVNAIGCFGAIGRTFDIGDMKIFKDISIICGSLLQLHLHLLSTTLFWLVS